MSRGHLARLRKDGKEMIGRILRKEMTRKKGVNFILFLFIIVATIFLASSVNNMLVVSNATEYFMDKAKIPDEFIGGRHIEGDTAIEGWLSGHLMYRKLSSGKYHAKECIWNDANGGQ